jgi:DNA-directed RNA polymerase subunit K/omega
MTYIPRHKVTDLIENKFEAIKVAALEARRLNERARMLGINLEGKITSIAIRRLLDGKVRYFDEKERSSRIQEEMEQEQEQEA